MLKFAKLKKVMGNCVSDQSQNPWKNGIYISNKDRAFIMKVNENIAEYHNIAFLDNPMIEPYGTQVWSSGDFGPAHVEVQKISGLKNTNIKMNKGIGVYFLGVISDNGETIHFFGSWNCVETLTWQSEEDLRIYSENREPFDRPYCPYKIQPEKQGKLVWLSGPSGAGKSTTGQPMGREVDYVYYDADCTKYNLNPFVPLDVENPTMSAFSTQNPLKDIPLEYFNAVREAESKIFQMGYGLANKSDLDQVKPFLSMMAKTIAVQKARIGGDFVVATSVATESMRDHIRTLIPDVIFITLSLTKDNQKRRIRQRHGDQDEGYGDMVSKSFDIFERPGQCEENTYNVDVTEIMKPNDVLNQVLEILNKNCK